MDESNIVEKRLVDAGYVERDFREEVISQEKNDLAWAKLSHKFSTYLDNMCEVKAATNNVIKHNLVYDFPNSIEF